jgi:hypothetical protein
MATEVTDEMRKAVYEADCAAKGHILDITPAFGAPSGSSNTVRGPDENTAPYLACRRCDKVWLVIEEPGNSYEEAETSLLDQLKATTPWSKRIKERKDRRKGKNDA